MVLVEAVVGRIVSPRLFGPAQGMSGPSSTGEGEAKERISANLKKWSSLVEVLQVLVVKGLA